MATTSLPDIESILKTLHSLVYEKADQIHEIAFVASDEILVHSNNVGIPSKLLKPLFRHCFKEFNVLRMSEMGDLERLSAVTVGMLLVRGDLPMVFNARKKLLVSGALGEGNELLFLKALFTLHPKSASGWEHRRWCLLRALTQTGGSVSSGTTSIQVHIDLNEELSLCARGAQDYPKNYYAWTQRLWLLRHLTPLLTPPRSSDDELTDSSDTGIIEERKQVSKKSKVGVVDASTESGGILAVLRGELQFTDNWLRSHTSDHCAISHRHQVYLLLMNSLEPTSSSNGSGLSGGSGADGCVHDSSVVPRILLHMFLSGRRLIDSRPGSESLWCGRRMAVKALLQHILSISVSNPSCGVDSDNMNTKNQLVSVLSESLRINPMSESDRCFEIHFLKLNDLTCISSMALWLDGFLGLEFAYFRQLGATGRNSAAILNAFPILDDNQHQLAEGNTADTIDEPTNGIAWNSEKQLELCKRYLTHLCFQVISFLSSLSNGRDETSLADLLARCQYVFKQLCDEQVTDGLRCEHMKKISDSYNSSAVEI